MITFTEAGETYLLDYLFKTTGVQLCLAADATLIEVVDAEYVRVDLADVMGDIAGGSVSNATAVTFSIGDEVASWWFITDAAGDEPVVFGPLPSPVTGTFTLPVGGLLFQAIAG
jgi:hypothetical protein